MSYLDQFVKGNSQGTEKIGSSSINGIILQGEDNTLQSHDQFVSLPSSQQIYLNLLILEASLRVQWLQLRTRRRQHTFFLTLLAFWIIYFGYALFLAPREDGIGVGGSVYWVVEVVEKLCLLGGVITGILVWGTGQWERGIRWPRRWVYCANRGLRVFNCKLVVIKQPWWIELYSMVSILFSLGLFSSSSKSICRHANQSLLTEHEKISKIGSKKTFEIEDCEEDLSPGGDHVKLLLLPKSFSAKFRENWDIYRTEYWEKENERRATLRKALLDREKRITKQQKIFFWWMGFRSRNKTKSKVNERANHSLNKHGLSDKDKSRFRCSSLKSGSHSRNSSQDVTTAFEVDEKFSRGHVRGSSTASTSTGKRKKGTSGKRQRHKNSVSRSSIVEYTSSFASKEKLSNVLSEDVKKILMTTSQDESHQLSKKVASLNGDNSNKL